MGTCKSCGEVASALEIVNDLCPKCQAPEQSEKLKNQEKNKTSVVIDGVSFWKHAFNWKYYIVPLIVGLLTAYDFSQTGEEMISKVKAINTIIGIIAAVQLKKHFGYKFGIFLIVGLFSGIVMAVTYLGSIFISEKIGGDSGKRQKAIRDILTLNNKMPMMLNDQLQLVKYTSPNNKTITMHMRFVNYTKNEILAEYSNNISQFESEMLEEEQKISCPQANLKNLLSTGLEINVEYLGKNNNIIGKVNLNNEKCKQY